MSMLPLDQIPTRYGWKYIDDLKRKQKNVSVVDLQKKIWFFFIEWDSKAERQKNLLTKYAPLKFSNRNDWVEASIAQSIEPSFTICVWFAESGLGKNLTTEGNIGNVGNTDGGDRRSYESPRAGISAISAVVNNNWLGGYMTIDQLSGWGNNRGPIYASSQTNWHENVTKCLSALEARYVWNESPFRLSEASLLLYQQEWFSLQ